MKGQKLGSFLFLLFFLMFVGLYFTASSGYYETEERKKIRLFSTCFQGTSSLAFPAGGKRYIAADFRPVPGAQKGRIPIGTRPFGLFIVWGKRKKIQADPFVETPPDRAVDPGDDDLRRRADHRPVQMSANHAAALIAGGKMQMQIRPPVLTRQSSDQGNDLIGALKFIGMILL